MSLPASARHRWGLDAGGEVGYLDIGDAVILIPGGVKRLRRQLLEAVTQEDWDRARRGLATLSSQASDPIKIRRPVAWGRLERETPPRRKADVFTTG